MNRKKNEDKPNKIYKEFEAGLKDAVEETISSYSNNDFDVQEYQIKRTKNRIVREFFEVGKEYKEAGKLIKKNYSYEYYQIEKPKYPISWMTNDKKINRTLENFSKLSPILNYVFNYNRWWRKEEFKNMVEINLSMKTGKHKSKYEYATFLATKDFFNAMAKDVGFKVPIIKKYFKAFCNAGIFIKFGQYKRYQGVLYSDGYFVSQKNFNPRKLALLKNNPDGKTGLRNFAL